jgi:hypothetical protein
MKDLIVTFVTFWWGEFIYTQNIYIYDNKGKEEKLFILLPSLSFQNRNPQILLMFER